MATYHTLLLMSPGLIQCGGGGGGVCVHSAHRKVLPYGSRSKVRLLTAT